MTMGPEEAFEAINEGWEAAGGYVSAAMQEVAAGLGGEEFAAAAASEDVLPNPAAFQLLEASFPGSAEAVMTHAEQLQQAAHRREFAALVAPRHRGLGRAILDAFRSFNLFGDRPDNR